MEVGDVIRVNGSQSRTISSVSNQGSLRRLNWNSSQLALSSSSSTKIDLVDNATATDNCDGNPVVTATGILSEVEHCGSTHIKTYVREFQAVDNAGNMSSATQTIRLIDETLPTISAPADVTLQCTASIPTTPAVAADQIYCDESLNLDTWYEDSISGDDDECGVEYTITRTHYATAAALTLADSCEVDTVMDVQIINIVDTVDPNFTNTGGLSNNATVEVPYDNFCGDVTLSDVVDATATDNCDTPVVCDQEGNADANALLDGMNIPHSPDDIAYLVDIDANGTNNPFLTGGAYTEGDITTPAVGDSLLTDTERAGGTRSVSDHPHPQRR